MAQNAEVKAALELSPWDLVKAVYPMDNGGEPPNDIFQACTSFGDQYCIVGMDSYFERKNTPLRPPPCQGRDAQEA